MISDLSTRVRQLRIANDMTQKELAERLGLSEAQIRAIEKGRRNTSINTCIEMSNLFNVSIDYLVAQTDIPTRLK